MEAMANQNLSFGQHSLQQFLEKENNFHEINSNKGLKKLEITYLNIS
jgi:hypothetical protein